VVEAATISTRRRANAPARVPKREKITNYQRNAASLIEKRSGLKFFSGNFPQTAAQGECPCSEEKTRTLPRPRISQKKAIFRTKKKKRKDLNRKTPKSKGHSITRKEETTVT